MSRIERAGKDFVVDADLVAEAFRLPADTVRALMRDGRLTSRCEAGEGEDAGRWRLSFYHGARVCRFTIDHDGSIRRTTYSGSPRPEKAG
ncbi:DUF6522 family protein [Amaricoccus sp.]|uniref:DUF6522 family protein n=1 Tax=Amaricoccus sp. TaxID=1872485 RepID=UPI00263051A9|nr:DUF6522 family protein [Amaricoccus sp.]HRO12108.1 DUF6522 family protein [Amaricoccus sp.]